MARGYVGYGVGRLRFAEIISHCWKCKGHGSRLVHGIVYNPRSEDVYVLPCVYVCVCVRVCPGVRN